MAGRARRQNKVKKEVVDARKPPRAEKSSGIDEDAGITIAAERFDSCLVQIIVSRGFLTPAIHHHKIAIPSTVNEA
jgi:hypothetical protein